MKKDTQFTFRIPSDLKSRLEEIATSEGRSVAQICEAFLKAGTESYKKKGFTSLRRFLSRPKKDSSE
jgi:predicted transcriptional regulator